MLGVAAFATAAAEAIALGGAVGVAGACAKAPRLRPRAVTASVVRQTDKKD